MSKNILIVAGGTGGHIFPAIAIAQQLKTQGHQIHWLGTADRMEASLIPQYGFPIHFIKISGIVSKGIKTWLKAPLQVMTATLKSRQIIKQVKPDVVIAMGGYASGPSGIAAKLCGIPLVIHEQNSVLGITNNLLSKVSNNTLSAFPLGKKWEQVGQPLRDEFNTLDSKDNLINYLELAKSDFARLKEIIINNSQLAQTIEKNDYANKFLTQQEYSIEAFDNLFAYLDENAKLEFNKQSLQANTLNVQIIGGSLGAKALNDNFPYIYKKLNELGYKLKVKHQSGKNKKDDLEKLLTQLDIDQTNYTVTEFITDVKNAYLDADLLICRSGAMTIFEIAATNRWAIFCPFPGHKDQQQLKNAQYLASNQTADIIEQPNFNFDAIYQVIKHTNYHLIYKKAYNLSKYTTPEACNKIVQVVQQYLI